MRALIPYLWAIPLGVLAWEKTHYDLWRGMGLPEVHLWAAWFVILLGYAITLVACHRRPLTVHQLGHFVVFEAATFLGFWGSDLQCIVGIIYMFMVMGTACIVVVAAVVLAVARLFGPRRQPGDLLER